MNYSKYRFNLDMQSYISQVSVPVRQNDTGVLLRINLTDGGVPYTIKDGSVAVFFAKKSDGSTVINYCYVEKNTTICYELTQATTCCKGIVDCEIRLYGADENIITTPRFILAVDARVLEGSDIDFPQSELTLLDNIIRSETVRQENEVEREENHKRMLATTEEASQLAATLRQKLDTGDYDGITPHIGANGNWWFKDEDTGILARGVTPHIGDNDNWWFNDVDTGVLADAGKHTHSADDITKGLLPILRGGTGAGNAKDALKNLGGITMATGSATEVLISKEKISGFTVYLAKVAIELNFDFTPKIVFLFKRKYGEDTVDMVYHCIGNVVLEDKELYHNYLAGNYSYYTGVSCGVSGNTFTFTNAYSAPDGTMSPFDTYDYIALG